MTDLEMIDLAVKQASDQMSNLEAKRKTKASIRQAQAYEVKIGNLEQFRAMINAGGELVGAYVSTDIGEEVGRVFQVSEKAIAEVEYFSDGGVTEHALLDLMYDQKATAEEAQDSSLISCSDGVVRKMVQLIDPVIAFVGMCLCD